MTPATLAPYPELTFKDYQHYDFKSKGPASAVASCYLQVGNCAGVCNFPLIFFGNFPFIEFFNAVTGRGMEMGEILETGARIQTMRQCFNIREGITAAEIRLPARMKGIPPMKSGPVAGITIDEQSLGREYRKAMGWEPDSGVPSEGTLKRLGLDALLTEAG